MSHPCETCLRWPECNGVDWGSCPDSLAQAEKENAPTEMAEFLTKKLQVPLVHITAEDLAKHMDHSVKIRCRILP